MFTVIKTKAGYAVQNTRTYTIVWSGKSQTDAQRIVTNLNK